MQLFKTKRSIAITINCLVINCTLKISAKS